MTLEFLPNLPKQTRRARRGGKNAPYTAAAVEDFIASGRPDTQVVIEGKQTQNMYQSFRLYLKNNPKVAETVALRLSAGQLFLERLDK